MLLRKKWTKEEEKYLEDNYEKLSFEEMAKNLCRTEVSVEGKVRRLGLKSGHYWTEDEVQYLKDNYLDKTYEEIADKLNRKETAVRAKVYKLKLPDKTRAYDLQRKVFGRLTVIDKIDKRNDKGSVIWKCKCECGNTAEVPTSQLTANKTTSCGCIRENMTGENHPSYNPLLTEEDRRRKRYLLGDSSTRNLRLLIFERDSFTCQHCRKVGGDLNAHHLNSWNTHKDQRFDLNNLVTLCIECHSSFHKVFGYGNNTTQQFEEFKILRKEV